MSESAWVHPGPDNGYRTCLSSGPELGERDRSEAAVRRLLEARRRRLRSQFEVVIEDTGSQIYGRLLPPPARDDKGLAKS